MASCFIIIAISDSASSDGPVAARADALGDIVLALGVVILLGSPPPSGDLGESILAGVLDRELDFDLSRGNPGESSDEATIWRFE